MAGIDIVLDREQPRSPSHPIPGHFMSAGSLGRMVSPSGYSLWLVTIELEHDGELTVSGPHGDEVVYVSAGSLIVDDRVCPQGGAVVIESQAAVVLRAQGPATLVHMGPTDPTVPTDGLNGAALPGGSVHVVGPLGTYAAVEPGRDTHYYADSTCPTCRLTLLYTSRSAEYVSSTHSHSVDELIHVVRGELRLGSQVVRAGDTLAVEAGRRYGFRSGPEGFGFLNYRSDASEQIVERNSAPRREGGAVNGLVPMMDLR